MNPVCELLLPGNNENKDGLSVCWMSEEAFWKPPNVEVAEVELFPIESPCNDKTADYIMSSQIPLATD